MSCDTTPNSIKKTRILKAARKNWTEKECYEILQNLIGVVRSGKVLEKHNANSFYWKVLEQLKISG